MKVCPFCKEEIRDEAIKCRYCSSSLLALQSTPENSSASSAPTPDQIVYVLDKGLIRFAKFVVAVLAIIVTVGVIFYGIDIKQAAKDAEESAKNVGDVRREALLTKDEIQKSKEAVAADLSEAGKQLDTTKAELSSVEERVRAIQAAEDKMNKLAAQLEELRKDILAKQQETKDLADRAEQYVATIQKKCSKVQQFDCSSRRRT